VENNFNIDEIINMGGQVELTDLLMVFVAEPESKMISETEYAPETAFAIVFLAENSQIQIIARKSGGLFGVIIKASNHKGVVAGEPNLDIKPPTFEDCRIEEMSENLNGSSFITSLIELERATAPRRRKKE